MCIHSFYDDGRERRATVLRELFQLQSVFLESHFVIQSISDFSLLQHFCCRAIFGSTEIKISELCSPHKEIQLKHDQSIGPPKTVRSCKSFSASSVQECQVQIELWPELSMGHLYKEVCQFKSSLNHGQGLKDASVAIVLMPNKKKIWGNFEGVTRCDTLKVFQVKLGSLAWASIKVAGSHADATDMLVSLFVIISWPSQGRNHIALMMLLTTKIVVMKRWMRMTREI